MVTIWEMGREAATLDAAAVRPAVALAVASMMGSAAAAIVSEVAFEASRTSWSVLFMIAD